MSTVVGLDARRPEAWITVRLEEGSLKAITHHETLDDVLEEAREAEAIAVDVPIGHDDREGSKRGGRRLADVRARELLGDAAERVYWTPPPSVFELDDHEQALERAREEGWPEPEEGMFAGRKRLLAVNRRALEDDRIVEVHPEVSYTALNEQLGGLGPLETYGRGPRATYERLELLAEVDLRPARSVGGVGRLSPRDVLEASVAAWSADRVARGEAQRFPKDPPEDPETGRPVAIQA